MQSFSRKYSNKCNEVEPDIDKLFYSMLEKYLDFTSIRAERILNGIKEIDILIPLKRQWGGELKGKNYM